jgi:hypothetical protein
VHREIKNLRELNNLSEEEWQAWYRLTPQERWRHSMKIWEWYVSVGGSLEPEPDPQSPFYYEELESAAQDDVQPDVTFVLRSGLEQGTGA